MKQYPSKVLLAARLKSGAGKHGGTAKAKNKRDRAAARKELRA